MEFSEFRLHRDPECPVCGEHPSVTELVDYAGFCGEPSTADTGGVGDQRVPEISAFELNARRQRGEKLLLLDVRSSDEFERAHIEGSTLIPASELECRLEEIDAWKQRPLVVLCHHGPRGGRAGALLLAQGFTQVENVSGGIEAWSLTVDSSVPRY
jgi:adenylyltransferase/sulfurtransferase